jgi:hypothetical protein
MMDNINPMAVDVPRRIYYEEIADFVLSHPSDDDILRYQLPLLRAAAAQLLEMKQQGTLN